MASQTVSRVRRSLPASMNSLAGIEDTRLDPLSPAKVTDGHLPSEAFQDDADLVFRGVHPAGLGPDLPDESLGLLGRDLCYVGLIGVVLRHFRLLSRWGRSIPCTGSTDTPPPSCFSPFKSAPLSLNAYRFQPKRSPHCNGRGLCFR